MTLIYAHRGANREAAENTRTAFDCALAYPIDGMETDVQLTRDGVAVLWHDRFLGKLGLPMQHIDDLDLAELQAMDFAAYFPGAVPESPMTLRDFLDRYRARCRLLIEIKNRAWERKERHAAKVAQVLELACAPEGDSILVSSFDLDSLIHAHRLVPDFPLVFNFEEEQGADEARRVLDAHPFLRGLCVHVSTLDAEMAAVLRERGKLLAVYTCNSDEEIDRVLRLGVDILITDLPQQALQRREA